LIAQLARMLGHLRIFRQQQLTPCAEPRKSTTDTRIGLVVEALAHGNDDDLVGGTRRSLCGRIESAQCLHHVANEFDAYRFDVGGGKDVDDAAADGEGAVLVDRVFTSEAGIDEEIGQPLRVDFGAGTDLERHVEEAFGRTDAWEERLPPRQ
jgi:hypothetical protein